MGKNKTTTFRVTDEVMAQLTLAMAPVTGVDPTRDFLTAGTATELANTPTRQKDISPA